MSDASLGEYLESLANLSHRVSALELQQLSGLDGSRADELRRAWPSLPLERRRQIVAEAVELAEDNVELDFAALLRLGLDDPDDVVRTRAIEGLWEDEEPSTALRLLELLAGDPLPRVRAAAASCLGHFVYLVEMGELSASRARRVRAGLLASIANPQEPVEVRRRAVEAIAYLSDPAVREVIRQAYADPDVKMRASALCAMGRNCDEVWLGTIVGELRSPSPEMRYEAARAAGELEDPRVVRPLVPLLVDEDPDVRLAAITALGQVGGETARKALEYTAQHGDEEAKAAAAEALAELSFDEDPLGLRVV